jgi:hypothetical protein
MSRNRRSLLNKRRLRRPRNQRPDKAARRRRQAARSDFDFRRRLHGYHSRIIWEWQMRGQNHRRYATTKGNRRLY